MFDIGFAELLLIGVVGLLVIGPERLPDAVRTGTQWLRHFKRSFNTIKQEIQQELEVDSVKKQLTQAGQDLKNQSEDFKQSLEESYQANLPGPEHDIPDDYEQAPAAEQEPQDNKSQR